MLGLSSGQVGWHVHRGDHAELPIHGLVLHYAAILPTSCMGLRRAWD